MVIVRLGEIDSESHVKIWSAVVNFLHIHVIVSTSMTYSLNTSLMWFKVF